MSVALIQRFVAGTGRFISLIGIKSLSDCLENPLRVNLGSCDVSAQASQPLYSANTNQVTQGLALSWCSKRRQLTLALGKANLSACSGFTLVFRVERLLALQILEDSKQMVIGTPEVQLHLSCNHPLPRRNGQTKSEPFLYH